MNHATIRQQLFAFHDGELTPQAAAEVRAHLGACAECRGVSEGWARTAGMLFKVSVPAPSEFFVSQVMRRVRELEAVPARRFLPVFSLRWLVPAVGVLMVFLTVAPPATQNFAMENMVFQDAGDRSSWMASGNTATADDTLAYVLEGAS